jgi:branched-chain amino acid transport system permease protein
MLDLVGGSLGALDFSTLPAQLVNGILLGAIYALIALGYTMVYGVLRLINFAHGEVFMLGAYAALFTSWALGFGSGQTGTSSYLNLILMLVVSMGVCAIIGVAIEFFAYRPMRNQSRIAALITAIGVSMLIQYAGQLFLPNQPPPSINEQVIPASFRESVTINLVTPRADLAEKVKTSKVEFDRRQALFDEVLKKEQRFNLSDSGKEVLASVREAEDVFKAANAEVQKTTVQIVMPKGQLAMLGMVVVIMGGLWWLVMKTKTGRAMRAVALDFDSASLMGINVSRIITITFLIGSALAGAGAMMQSTFLGTTLNPFYGSLPGVKAFVAAVLGGIGNIPGAVLGGLLMGLAEALVIWAGFSGWKDAVAFIVLTVVLLVRPGGLLGSNKVEKV